MFQNGKYKKENMIKPERRYQKLKPKSIRMYKNDKIAIDGGGQDNNASKNNCILLRGDKVKPNIGRKVFKPASLCKERQIFSATN